MRQGFSFLLVRSRAHTSTETFSTTRHRYFARRCCVRASDSFHFSRQSFSSRSHIAHNRLLLPINMQIMIMNGSISRVYLINIEYYYLKHIESCREFEIHSFVLHIASSFDAKRKKNQRRTSKTATNHCSPFANENNCGYLGPIELPLIAIQSHDTR